MYFNCTFDLVAGEPTAGWDTSWPSQSENLRAVRPFVFIRSVEMVRSRKFAKKSPSIRKSNHLHGIFAPPDAFLGFDMVSLLVLFVECNSPSLLTMGAGPFSSCVYRAIGPPFPHDRFRAEQA